MQLLSGFGMSQQLAGGTGTMHFAAGWNGSPAAFNLATLDGTLESDMRDGRLLEVEPGAGACSACSAWRSCRAG